MPLHRLLLSSRPLLASPIRIRYRIYERESLVFHSPEIKTFRDLHYYEGADAHPRKHLLDLYLPSPGKPFPLVVFVHGGTWSRGDKDDRGGAYGILGRSLVQKGIGVAVTNYRLSPQVRHPDHARDVARATAWIYRHSKQYGWDPKGLFLMGHSAGGHLSSLVAVDPRYLKEHNLTPEIIRGVVTLSGVYDLTKTGITGQFVYETAFTAAPETLRGASPALQIKTRPPPFLLLYAENDYLSATFQAHNFLKALKSAGGEGMTRRIPGRNHVDIVVGLAKPGDPVQKAVVHFIRKRSKGSPGF